MGKFYVRLQITNNKLNQQLRIFFHFFDDQYTQSKYTLNGQLLDVITNVNKNQSLFDFRLKLYQDLQTISNKSLVAISHNFEQIFTYFSQFSEHLNGYDEMTILKIVAENQLNIIKNIRSGRLKELKKK
ncbi:unnamed protein product [Paramecium sonneborni]|uniref:Uncharacterized protein n=1 Tax=Paramecium sonneborni TaxID=65129 RepID=A0A8S1RWU5_9CILI|nr:unnamed protein product [Paramecium sonneborni]